MWRLVHWLYYSCSSYLFLQFRLYDFLEKSWLLHLQVSQNEQNTYIPSL